MSSCLRDVTQSLGNVCAFCHVSVAVPGSPMRPVSMRGDNLLVVCFCRTCPICHWPSSHSVAAPCRCTTCIFEIRFELRFRKEQWILHRRRQLRPPTHSMRPLLGLPSHRRQPMGIPLVHTEFLMVAQQSLLRWQTPSHLTSPWVLQRRRRRRSARSVKARGAAHQLPSLWATSLARPLRCLHRHAAPARQRGARGPMTATTLGF